MPTSNSVALVVFVVIASLAATACKNDSSSSGAQDKGAKKEEKIASCDVIKQESMCREWSDANIAASGQSFLSDLCTGNLQGTFAMSACPKDKRVGACTTPEGTRVFYTDGPAPLDAAAAEKACKEGVPAGQWKAGG